MTAIKDYLPHPGFLIAILALFYTISGCALATPEIDPFKVPQTEIYAKVKTIALFDFAATGVDATLAAAKFEPLIEGKLREGGFSFVPLREAIVVNRRLAEQMGGIYDPKTGDPDQKKRKIVYEHGLHELKTRFGADAILIAAIVPATATFSAYKARWHGNTESVLTSNTGALDFLVAPQGGMIQALSLFIGMRDVNEDAVVYANLGGIQLVEKVAGTKRIRIANNELLTNEERNQNAVNIVLGPLLKKGAPSGIPAETAGTGGK